MWAHPSGNLYQIGWIFSKKLFILRSGTFPSKNGILWVSAHFSPQLFISVSESIIMYICNFSFFHKLKKKSHSKKTDLSYLIISFFSITWKNPTLLLQHVDWLKSVWSVGPLLLSGGEGFLWGSFVKDNFFKLIHFKLVHHPIWYILWMN